jgi:hypothetical protein
MGNPKLHGISELELPRAFGVWILGFLWNLELFLPITNARIVIEF